MVAKKIFLLIFSALTLSIISLLIICFGNSLSSSYNTKIGKLILPNFVESNIKEIRLIKPTGLSINLIHEDNNLWRVENYFFYQADPEKMNSLLQELSSIKVIQTINIDPSELRSLKLLDPLKKDKDSGTEIRIIGSNNKILYSLIVGEKRVDNFASSELLKGRYLLIYPAKIPLLCEEDLSQTEYLAKDFLSQHFIKIENMKKIQLSRGKDLLWTILKEDQNADYKLLDRKKEDLDINIDALSSIVSSLESLKFDSVANPEMSMNESGLDKPYTLNIQTFSGDSFSIDVGKKVNNFYYVKIDSKSFPIGKKWIYMVDDSRIDPLIKSRNDLTRKKKRMQGKIYSSPIS